jgi:hypothetical protein
MMMSLKWKTYLMLGVCALAAGCSRQENTELGTSTQGVASVNPGLELVSVRKPRSGTASLKGATLIKRSTVDSSSLSADQKCAVSDPATLLAYSNREEAAAGHMKVTLKFADASCPAFSGTVYLFGPHWEFKDN